MSSESVRTRPSPRRLRHPGEVPFSIFMVVLSVIIIAAILDAAWVLPFLPDRLKDTGWAIAVRTALLSLLLLVPALIVIRETQRASVRGTAVQLHHVSLWYQIVVAYSQPIPLLGPALSRLREYSCDRHGAYLSPLGATGLVLLASGRYTETDVDLDELLRQGRRLRGFWVGVAQLVRSHPFTVRRLERLYGLGLFHTGVQPVETRV
jgi:Peptidase family M48